MTPPGVCRLTVKFAVAAGLPGLRVKVPVVSLMSEFQAGNPLPKPVTSLGGIAGDASYVQGDSSIKG